MMCQEGFEIATYGLEKAEELKDIKQLQRCQSLKEVLQKSHTIVASVPLSKDGIYVNTPYSDSKIEIEQLYQGVKAKRLISGNLDARFQNDSSLECYDILEREEYAVLNAIATAEGAIQIAMEEFPKTLSGSNILVMGFGRIGKVLSKMLQGIGAHVYCEARKEEDLAYIQAFGYTPIPLEELESNLHQFDIIFNNIPVKILNQPQLDLVKKEVLIIDLASKPGGVDFEYAQKQNIKTIWALALPGKVAPASAAEYIKKTIQTIMKNT